MALKVLYPKDTIETSRSFVCRGICDWPVTAQFWMALSWIPRAKWLTLTLFSLTVIFTAIDSLQRPRS